MTALDDCEEAAVARAIYRRSPEAADALNDLRRGTHTPKQIAQRLGVTPDAVYVMRRRFERSTGVSQPRHERRGRKPAPLN